MFARGDRLVETDPDCRARLALSASEGHDADTVRRDAQGCGARTCSPSRPSFWCKTGPDTLARATIASYYKEAGSLESQKFRVPLIRLTFTHGATVWVPAESWRWATCCFFGGGIPHVFHVEHVSDGASMRGDAVTAYRQTIPGLRLPAPRASPACELSQQSGSSVEVNALARRRPQQSLSGIRGGARETHVAQPEDTGAPCGQEPRGVHSTHGARAHPQDL